MPERWIRIDDPTCWSECPGRPTEVAGKSENAKPVAPNWSEGELERVLAQLPGVLLGLLEEPGHAAGLPPRALAQVADIDLLVFRGEAPKQELFAIELKKQGGANAVRAASQLARNLSRASESLSRAWGGGAGRRIIPVLVGAWRQSQIRRAQATRAAAFLEKTCGTELRFLTTSLYRDGENSYLRVSTETEGRQPKRSQRAEGEQLARAFREAIRAKCSFKGDECKVRLHEGLVLRARLYGRRVALRLELDKTGRDEWLASGADGPAGRSAACTAFHTIRLWAKKSRAFSFEERLGQRFALMWFTREPWNGSTQRELIGLVREISRQA